MRTVIRFMLVGSLALGLVPMLQGTAWAVCSGGLFSGNYRGWNPTQCDGSPFFISTAPAGSLNVDIANNALSSAKNGTNNKWCGPIMSPRAPGAPGLRAAAGEMETCHSSCCSASTMPISR